MQEEIWKDVPGYEGYYQCSNFGNFKSLTRTIITKNNKKITYKNKILKKTIGLNGYYMITFSKNDKNKHFLAHRITALLFITNKYDKKYLMQKI